jgi:hypothetical protein
MIWDATFLLMAEIPQFGSLAIRQFNGKFSNSPGPQNGGFVKPCQSEQLSPRNYRIDDLGRDVSADG